MFTIELDHHLDAMASMMSELKERSIKFVVANALDDATSAALERLQNDTDEYIDKPTHWTKKSTYKTPRRVTPTKMDMINFGFKQLAEGDKGTPAGEYLKPIAAGGARTQKPFEQKNAAVGFAIPRNVGTVTSNQKSYKFALNQYGNLPRSQYTAIAKILSGQNKNPAIEFFRATIRGVDGIYMRVDKTKNLPKPDPNAAQPAIKNKRKPKLTTEETKPNPKPRGYVLAFNRLSSAPTYAPQFPVSDLLTEYFNDIFETSLQNAVDDELETYMQRRLQGKD